MTRVVVLPADDSGCGYYRMRLPAGAIRTVRPDWNVEVYKPGEVMMGTDEKGNLHQIAGIPYPRSVDLVVMQRVATVAQVQLVEWFQRQGAGVVVDSDDAMWCIDQENSAYSAWNNSRKYSWRHVDTAARIADMVTVTTPLLAKRYGTRGHAEVLPNCVPGDLPLLLESVRPHLDQTVTLGWAGFTSTHPGDLRVVGDAVRRVQEETGCIVRVVGDAEGASRDWGCPVEKVNPTPVGLPFYTALTSIDIGVVPLRATQFNKGKSYLKALEFAAVGVPVVCSPSPANSTLGKTVPVTFAATPEEWYRALLEHVNRVDWRIDRGHFSQQAVLKHHTYEGAAEQWAQVWERATARRRKMFVL